MFNSLFIFSYMSCLSNGKYQNCRAQVCSIGVLIVKISFLCQKWVWRAATVMYCQTITFMACIACWGDHVHYIGGQWWLSRPSAFCLLRHACYGIECEYRQLWSV